MTASKAIGEALFAALFGTPACCTHLVVM